MSVLLVVSPCQKAGSDWPYSHSLALVLPQNPSPARAADGVPRCATKEPEELAQQEYWPAAAPHHLLPGNTISRSSSTRSNIHITFT